MRENQSQVVVAFNFTTSSRFALERAIMMAARAPFHVLHVLCVAEPHAGVPGISTGKVDFAYTERVQMVLTDLMEAELKSLVPSATVHFHVHVRIGKPAKEILRLAREIGADLIIVGNKGLTGAERFLLGSVSGKVAAEAGCPVEIARPKKYAEVELLDVEEVEASHHHYTPPHRYSYSDNRVTKRPTDWTIG